MKSGSHKVRKGREGNGSQNLEGEVTRSSSALVSFADLAWALSSADFCIVLPVGWTTKDTNQRKQRADAKIRPRKNRSPRVAPVFQRTSPFVSFVAQLLFLTGTCTWNAHATWTPLGLSPGVTTPSHRSWSRQKAIPI